MTCLKKQSAAFALLLSAVLIFSVEGQFVPKAQCSTTIPSTTANLGGSEQTTYYNVCLCAADAACDANTGRVATTIFCGLIDLFTDIKDYLEGDNPHTIFVPSDAAFNEFTATSINQLSLEARRRIVEIHIIPSLRLTTDLICNEHAQTLNLRGGVNGVQQYTKTLCRNGGAPIQIGPGNSGPNLPQIGSPNDIFRLDEFQYNYPTDSDIVFPVNQLNPRSFGQDAISCNGVAHTVRHFIRPDGLSNDAKGGKSGKSAKRATWNWRHERQLGDQEKEESVPLGRKRSLEVLLEANGDVVIQDEEADREDRKSRIESNLESLLEPN